MQLYSDTKESIITTNIHILSKSDHTHGDKVQRSEAAVCAIEKKDAFVNIRLYRRKNKDHLCLGAPLGTRVAEGDCVVEENRIDSKKNKKKMSELFRFVFCRRN